MRRYRAPCPRIHPERQRPYLLVGSDGPADVGTVIDLLERAIDGLRELSGPVTVQGMTYEHDGDTRQASCTRTVY